jgi:hypothetical protein
VARRPQSRGVSSPAAALLLLVTVAACDEERDYDAFPIRLERAGGAMLAAVDVLSPVTRFDVTGGDATTRRRVDLLLYGVGADGGTVPRSRVLDLGILDGSPCGAATCQVGAAGDARAIGGVVGADVLAAGGRAARFDFTRDELTFFAGIAGSRGERTAECDAVMNGPFAGGGTLLVEGAEVGYVGRRPVLEACLAYGAVDQDGVDALLAISTGIGQSVLAASAWDRLAAAEGLPAAADLPRGELLVPSGSIAAGLGTVPRLALVGDLGSASEGRGPCRERYANRLMEEVGTCEAAGVVDCPCRGEDGVVCDAAAAVDLQRPLEVAVIDDLDPLLQSLRDELRPAQAELDGILAADALQGLRLDLDYPNDRLMLRCLDQAACDLWPAVLDTSELARCEQANLPDAGPETP